MGTWGVGPFSNDDAADFLGDLADLDPREVQDNLLQALQLPSDGYVESPEADTAIAAAALVAMQNGYVPPDNVESAAGFEFEVTDQLHSASSAALRRVQGTDSEWAELWDEAGELSEATRILADIAQHLS